ncbi:MAG: hypothetical protein JO189_28930 [Deltaproteobacteria bacterium]|nr:hypothetical protein [Deltaproteobacteria bacterium]
MTNHIITRIALVCGLFFAAEGFAFAQRVKSFSFNMIVSSGAAECLPYAKAQVKIESLGDGTAEDLYLTAEGLPPNTDFDFFVIQVPNKPFGLAWYNGDVLTDSTGSASQHLRNRFQFGTFVIAPGVTHAPQTHTAPPFPDALKNPETIGPNGVTTGPVQLYHLGLWFDSATDAQNAGCPNTVTPFNSQHDAGIQVLNTANYPDTLGPLSHFNP